MVKLTTFFYLPTRCNFVPDNLRNITSNWYEQNGLFWFESRTQPFGEGGNHMFLPHAHWWKKIKIFMPENVIRLFLRITSWQSVLLVFIFFCCWFRPRAWQNLFKVMQASTSPYLKIKPWLFIPLQYECFLLYTNYSRMERTLGFPPLRSNFVPSPPSLKFLIFYVQCQVNVYVFVWLLKIGPKPTRYSLGHNSMGHVPMLPFKASC